MTDEAPVDEDKRATLRRFAALGATAPFAGAASAETDDNDARSAIAGYLSTTPGAHFSKVRDELQLGTGETQYHLEELIDSGTVDTEKDGDYRRYFLADQFSAFERRALGALRRDTQRQIMLELLKTPGCSGTTIADEVGISRPAVSNHIGQLEAKGIVDRTDSYVLTEPETTAVLLVRFADTFGPEAAAFASDADELLSHDP